MPRNTASELRAVRLLRLACLLALLTSPTRLFAADAAVGSPAEHFDRQIAPLLSRRCLDCHNATDQKGGLDLTTATTAKAGGDSGPAIESGKPDGSLLWSRIAADEMPPKHPLPAADASCCKIGLSRGQNGARRRSIAFAIRPKRGLDMTGGRYSPLFVPRFLKQQTMIGRVATSIAWCAWLRAALAPSVEADRLTLIRRLTFDLTGLPPTPEEIAVFLNDAGDGAYERVVDRLLASPQYGVRWARHWLDVVRFGESNGFEYDELRPQAWPYRDWVVHALNDDLPYDEFVRMQLAGDCLRPDDLDAAIATGFLAAGAYDTAGQNQQSAAMRAVVRQDELEDLVGTVAQTFLGLTVNCARCHDHKFDPIRQSEYYAIVSALSGVRHGNRELAGLTPPGKRRRRRRHPEPRRKELDRNSPRSRGPPARRRGQLRTQPVELRPLAAWDFRQDR